MDAEPESRWTLAVMRWLQTERPGTFEPVGYSFASESVSEYAEGAKRWLRNHSELSTRCINRADYSVALEFFKNNK